MFPDSPRFCRLMKNSRSSGMKGDKPGKSAAFVFSLCFPDFCDGRRSFPINSNLYRRVRRRRISLISNPLNCLAPVPLSQINMASLSTSDIIGKIWDRPLANIRYIGKIWDGRQKVKCPIVWDFLDIFRLSVSFTAWIDNFNLVFTCQKHPRRSGILLFADHPRFCRCIEFSPEVCPRFSRLFSIGGLELSNLILRSVCCKLVYHASFPESDVVENSLYSKFS